MKVDTVIVLRDPWATWKPDDDKTRSQRSERQFELGLIYYEYYLTHSSVHSNVTNWLWCASNGLTAACFIWTAPMTRQSAHWL